MRAVGVFGIVMVVVVVLVSIAMVIDYSINVSPQYRRAIGSYIDNAYDAASFETMAANLNRTKQGMIDQGLSQSDCGKAWSWEQTPDWCMAYQYQYLDSLINSTLLQYRYFENLKQSGQLIDPSKYNDAMNKQREEFGRNGPVDWVAYPAWLLKYHGFYYWATLWGVLLAVIAIVGALLIWVDVAEDV